MSPRLRLCFHVLLFLALAGAIAWTAARRIWPPTVDAGAPATPVAPPPRLAPRPPLSAPPGGVDEVVIDPAFDPPDVRTMFDGEPVLPDLGADGDLASDVFLPAPEALAPDFVLQSRGEVPGLLQGGDPELQAALDAPALQMHFLNRGADLADPTRVSIHVRAWRTTDARRAYHLARRRIENGGVFPVYWAGRACVAVLPAVVIRGRGLNAALVNRFAAALPRLHPTQRYKLTISHLAETPAASLWLPGRERYAGATQLAAFSRAVGRPLECALIKELFTRERPDDDAWRPLFVRALCLPAGSSAAAAAFDLAGRRGRETSGAMVVFGARDRVLFEIHAPSRVAADLVFSVLGLNRPW